MLSKRTSAGALQIPTCCKSPTPITGVTFYCKCFSQATTGVKIPCSHLCHWVGWFQEKNTCYPKPTRCNSFNTSTTVEISKLTNLTGVRLTDENGPYHSIHPLSVAALRMGMRFPVKTIWKSCLPFSHLRTHLPDTQRKHVILNTWTEVWERKTTYRLLWNIYFCDRSVGWCEARAEGRVGDRLVWRWWLQLEMNDLCDCLSGNEDSGTA